MDHFRSFPKIAYCSMFLCHSMKKLLSSCCCLFIVINLLATPADKNTFFFKKQQVITIDGNQNSFSRQVQHFGQCPPNKQQRINIYFGELDNLEDVQAKFLQKGKWKNIKQKDMMTSSVPSRPFDEQKKLIFDYERSPSSFPIAYGYKKTTSDLMFLSSIHLFDHIHTDTFYYELHIPTPYKLQYKVDPLATSEKVFSIVEKKEGDKTIYIFQSTAKQRVGLSEDQLPNIRLLVHHKSKQAFDFFNDWYYDLVQPMTKLNKTSLKIVESVVKEEKDDKTRIKAIYDFVKEKISYIDIENGIGAVQPRNVNDIFEKKKGDCKDMSNLLCQSLRHVGYESYMALSATLSHWCDLDFPSIASANHAICVVRFEDSWLYLDATEEYGLLDLPSRQIQDRTLFIIDEDKGKLHKVEKVNAERNKAHSTIQLEQIDNRLEGKSNAVYHGLSQLPFLHIKNYTTEQKAQSALQNYFESFTSNMEYKNITLLDSLDMTYISNQVRAEKNITYIGNKAYLSLAFLPFPHQEETHLENDKKLTTYTCVNNQYSIAINLKTNYKLQAIENVLYKKDGLYFSFEVKQVNPKKIEINYSFVNNHLEIKDDLINSYNEINMLIEQTLQKSIVYEKQH